MRTRIATIAALAGAVLLTPRLEAQVARIDISPTEITAGEMVQLVPTAYDAAGNRLNDVQFRFAPAGGYFEGRIDPNGRVMAIATGTLPIGVVAITPGNAQEPFVQRFDIPMVPGDPTAIDLVASGRRIVVGQRMNLAATSYSEYGDPRDDTFEWTSSNPAVARVDALGRVEGVAPGTASITAATGGVRQSVEIEVTADRIASIELTPSTAEGRTGDVIHFTATPRDASGAAISGLTPSFSLAPGNGMVDAEGAFVGYRPGEYTVRASFGPHTTEAVVNLTTRDVRRPLTVLGRLPRSAFSTEEVWPHPTADVVYLGTGSGGDRMYAIDVSDPENPFVTDSLVADTRRVNDIMTTPDGRYLVHTRENASSRQNGIVIASLEDPRHPQKIAEFTDGVTAGVHSAFVYEQPGFGTHVYLTNNGTNALHIVDISDPANPREVAQWRAPTPGGGGSLHDVDVQDGIAYLSNWNEGLIVLDVGNGIREGSPSNPQLITQYKYDLNEMYRNVEIDGGPGFIRGTHTAWRHRQYVFIADEVFPTEAPRGTKDASANRAYGNLQVIDVSDWANPKSVAWYTPEDGGVHNVWVDGEILYMGAYNSGFRAFDISGELMGDLKAQGREIAHLNTADMDGQVPNQAMTWGVVVKDGLAYVNDNHNGLWIVRLDPRPELSY